MEAPTHLDDVLTLEDAATVLGVSDRTMRRVMAGEFGPPPRGRAVSGWRLTRRSLIRWLEEGDATAPGPPDGRLARAARAKAAKG